MEKKDSEDIDSQDRILGEFARDFGRPPTALEEEFMRSFDNELRGSESVLDADFTNTIALLEEHGTEYEAKLRETIVTQFLNPLTPEEKTAIEQADTKENSVQLHTEILERKWGKPLTDLQKITVRNIWTDSNFLRNDNAANQEMINFLRNWRTIGESVGQNN